MVHWPGATVVCAASGPSLTAADLLRCHGAKILAVSNAVRLCLRVDALYSAEMKWW